MQNQVENLNLEGADYSSYDYWKYVLKNFIQEYRQFLNNMQLWYIRVDFDVGVGHLKESELMKNYETMVKRGGRQYQSMEQ
mmetsp:Transcript_27988/g.27027  ORF Transcript_27988/g.27027 Transcript_27988/m.27027 type:complete len:81 (-) Transcript_27988:201-443(-)